MVMESLLVIVISQHCQCMVCGMNIRTFYPSQKIGQQHIYTETYSSHLTTSNLFKAFLNDCGFRGSLSVIHLCWRCTMFTIFVKSGKFWTLIFWEFRQSAKLTFSWPLHCCWYQKIKISWFLLIIKAYKSHIAELVLEFADFGINFVCCVLAGSLHWLLGWVLPLVG